MLLVYNEGDANLHLLKILAANIHCIHKSKWFPLNMFLAKKRRQLVKTISKFKKFENILIMPPNK